jgi:hypothetical protein
MSLSSGPTAFVLPLVGVVRRNLDEDVSLAALARAARRSTCIARFVG